MRERVKIVNEYLTTITSILSFFGTLFIIVSYFVWKDIRSKSRRILVYISIADFCTAVATVAATASFWLTGSETKQVCFIQSIIGTLSVLCSFFWTAFMAVYLYLNVCKKTSRLANRLLYFFHMCGWGVPVVIVSIGASTNKLGNNGDQVTSGWCWVNKTLPWNEQVLWMFLAGKLWEIMACLVIVLLYGLLKRSMAKKVSYNSVWNLCRAWHGSLGKFWFFLFYSCFCFVFEYFSSWCFCPLFLRLDLFLSFVRFCQTFLLFFIILIGISFFILKLFALCNVEYWTDLCSAICQSVSHILNNGFWL